MTLLDRLTASDVLDGDISKTIRITSQNIVNSQPGVYNVTAQVDSRLGEPVVLPLKVVITTGETQLIWLKDYLIYLPQGASFDCRRIHRQRGGPGRVHLAALSGIRGRSGEHIGPRGVLCGLYRGRPGPELHRLSDGGGGIRRECHG